MHRIFVFLMFSLPDVVNIAGPSRPENRAGNAEQGVAPPGRDIVPDG